MRRTEKKLKEVLLQVDDERRNTEQYKDQVRGFHHHRSDYSHRIVSVFRFGSEEKIKIITE